MPPKKAQKVSAKKAAAKRVASKRAAAVSEPRVHPYSVKRAGGHKNRELLARRLEGLVERFTDEAVQVALGQNDVSVIATLASPESWRDSVDPLRAARLRGARQHLDILQEADGTLTTAEAADLLGIGEEAVRKRIREGGLIGLRRGRGYIIPAIQIREGNLVPGLSKVLHAMAITSPWARLNWLLSPEPRLNGRRPIEVLSSGGDVEVVRVAASMVGEQGAA